MGLRGPGAKPVRRQYFGLKRGRKETSRPWQSADLSRANKVIAFLETLPVTSGTLAGETFKVRDWQRAIIEGIYAVNDEGQRLVRQALITIPRKNGKTGLAAGLAICHLCGPEAEPRGQVYSAAAERKQAALLYEEMKAIITRVRWMRDRIIVRDFTKQLEDLETGSIFYALSADASTKHGLNTSCWIYDELAQAKDRKLYDVLATSTAARHEPLGIVISTQSEDPRHIMSELVDYGQQVLDGIHRDPSFFACIYTAPMDADPWSEKTWAACNPALGDFRSLQEMRDSAKQAQRIPARENTFRLLYLNQRVSHDVRFLPKPIWDACGESPKEFNLASLRGRTCYGGLDLAGSGKNDLTSLVLTFEMEDGAMKALPFFWSAEEALLEAESRDHMPYRLWAKQGHLITTPGRTLEYGFIAQKMVELAQQYNIESIAVDPWNIERMAAALENIRADVTLLKHGQSVKDFDSAVTALESAALSRKLRHNKNPVLDWCMDSVMVTHDSSGNRKFDKRRSIGRIDGAVALAMACNLSANVETKKPAFQVLWV